MRGGGGNHVSAVPWGAYCASAASWAQGPVHAQQGPLRRSGIRGTPAGGGGAVATAGGVEERTIGSWPPPCSLRAGGTVASGHDCDGEGAAEAALLAAVHDDDDNGRFVEIEESYAAGEAAESTTGCTEDARLAALLEDEEHVKEHGRFRSGG